MSMFRTGFEHPSPLAATPSSTVRSLRRKSPTASPESAGPLLSSASQSSNALDIINTMRNRQEMKEFQRQCEERVRKEVESEAARSRESDRGEIIREEAATLRNEYQEAMQHAELQVRQREATLRKAEQDAMNRCKQNQIDLERRASEWHAHAVRQIDETAKQQKIKAQQLEAEEQRLQNLQKLLARKRDAPLALEDRNRNNDMLALEDADSIGVRRRAEAREAPPQDTLLKNKIKTLEDKLALSQKATSEAEGETENMQRQLNTTMKDFQDCRRKNEQVMETLAKQEQRENNLKADISKMKLAAESAQDAAGRANAALEEELGAAIRGRVHAENQLKSLESDYQSMENELEKLRAKIKIMQDEQDKLQRREEKLRQEHAEMETLQDSHRETEDKLLLSERELASFRNQLRNLKESHDAKERDLTEQKRLLAKAAEDQKRFSKESKDLKEVEVNLTKEVQDLRAELGNLKEDMSKSESAAKKKHAVLEEQFSMQKAESENLALEHEETRELCSSMELEKKRLQMRAEHAETLVNGLETELEMQAVKAKRVKAELEGELQSLKQQLQLQETTKWMVSASEGEFQETKG